MNKFTRFNPRTREGATEVKVLGPDYMRVSIHAPVRVRLFQVLVAAKDFIVSIHAPVRVRLGGGLPVNLNPGFNPRTREGATVRREQAVRVT